MDNMYKKVVIKTKRVPAIKRRHPWIFSGGIKSHDDCQDGDIVEVYTVHDEYLCTGYFQHGSIMVRILSFDQVAIDQSYWVDRIIRAKKLRGMQGIPDDLTTAYRLIHGEGDGLSGLVIDIYGPVAVVQCHTIFMYQLREEIGEAIKCVFGDALQAIYVKSGHTLPPRYQGYKGDYFLVGEQAEVSVLEHGRTFCVNVVEGQKTGFFLDQRPNRLLLSRYAGGQDVLNLFCYTGGFSIYALTAGAQKVTSVDISSTAMQMCSHNADLNAASSHHQCITADVMQYLQEVPSDQHDIIVVDPPAFAKSQNKRHNAVQAYKRLNAAAIKKVKSGGMLFTFSCSQVVDNELFRNTIRAAAIEVQRECQVIHLLGQGGDHPVNMYHPEGRYLKGLVMRVTD